MGDRWEIAAATGGGWVASYKRAFESMEGTGLEVRVKDVCASACTMVLHSPRACAERAAMFGFHEAWVESEDGQARAHRATNRVWSEYPEHVRAELGQLYSPDGVDQGDGTAPGVQNKIGSIRAASG